MNHPPQPHDGFTPPRLVVELILTACDPRLPWDIRMDAADAARIEDPASAVGGLVGIIHGVLAALEARTHGLITAEEVYDDLATEIRCKLTQPDRPGADQA